MFSLFYRRALSKNDRKSFIRAVFCLKSKPSVYPAGAVPGSKSLYDDFVGIHLNNTLFIHLSVSRQPATREDALWYSQ